ncbi:sigma 54-interacting transcriptional regulator [Aeromonas jandaei]|uniref:sigma 54-interacting transcriptional regulator n=1 Tax=Aeromonas jandaei TaxID=650 RepID=UPI00059D6A45|nr:sigma 54-interacting transcriptional regulator [Aeromonas jandaei]BBQ53113.1 sigma-54-dependent Fis family transcriptional regulator [Aeromonas veronii]MBL0628946.1 sigma 54-interacting transcriptional regulator [Aeromonas jandaei]MBL0668635.1 sigma 54-interacting transcriptional regulator [Aeromonas jandaei]QNF18451.1 AAA family ATPase [Aeromonas jandaei]BCS47687.1 sigma-54-dependent Fis family transcriptional regulator [Aeromonas jandaei]
MRSVSNQCLLMQIQPTILRFAKMLASVLQLEVEIVDADMVRVAGTGPYGKFFGRQLEGDSRLLRYVIDNQREKIVTHTSDDPVCEGCSCKESCRERAFLGVPIMVDEGCIGVISLVAFSAEQQARLNNNLQDVCDYVRHISTIFVAKLLDSRGLSDGVNKVFLDLMTHMDQGCLLLDEKNQVRFANEAALHHLGCQPEQLQGREVGIRPLTFARQEISGHIQHIFTLGDRQELIIGQLHHVQGQQLFLMAFHQSHSGQVREPDPDVRIDLLIGESKPMRNLKRLLQRIAQSPSSVLICGESGTGKEVVARAVHRLSPRHDKPFIAINCAAIPEQLLESELFGYVKGSFTGASSGGKQGLIQAAHQGTLFLDEIGDMPLTMQAKLLRVLELREVTPIGASRPVPVDIRIIAATHQHLDQYIAEGKFREDLFYRINVIPLNLPPLREREGDVELLTHYFLNQHTSRIGTVYPGLTPEVMALLKGYRWPGNVRELSNLIEYLVNVSQAGEVIDSSLLPPNIIRNQDPHPVVTQTIPIVPLSAIPSEPVAAQGPMAVMPEKLQDPAPGESGLESMEKQMIEETLQRLGNKKLAAQALGIGIATLYRKIKKYDIAVQA